MEPQELYKLRSLLKTATESINEAMALAKKPEGVDESKRKIYVTQLREKGSKYDEGWRTLFADVDSAAANEWVNRRNSENSSSNNEYRVLTIDLYLPL